VYEVLYRLYSVSALGETPRVYGAVRGAMLVRNGIYPSTVSPYPGTVCSSCEGMGLCALPAADEGCG
jgi:hypothetical protein